MTRRVMVAQTLLFDARTGNKDPAIQYIYARVHVDRDGS